MFALLRSRPLFILAVLGAAGSLVHCAAGSDSGRNLSGSGPVGTGGAPRLPVYDDISGAGTGGTLIEALDPLCGTQTGACIPDDADACSGYGGEGNQGGASNGAAGAAALAGAAGQGVNLPSDSGSLGPSGYGCHLGSQGGEVTRSCQPSGQGEPDAPCLSSADCAAGLVCVGEGSSGLCRPYCCRGVETSCDSGFYCAPRRVVGTDSGLEAPVCVRADQCSLTETYPCPEGVDCQCKGGTACVIVRADGTTSCVTPGQGKAGEACDDVFSCAWGHVCSRTNGCVELCSTVSNKQECGDNWYCQARFPANVGVCIDLDEQTGATK